MKARQVTVADMAAMLGVTPARIRQIIAKHKIQPTGRRWKAKLYDPHEIARHAGWKHRSRAAERARRLLGLHSEAVPHALDE